METIFSLIRGFVAVVWLMSQCEGMHDSKKKEAGNVTALERKRLTEFRKCAVLSSRALTWNTFVSAHCFNPENEALSRHAGGGGRGGGGSVLPL